VEADLDVDVTHTDAQAVVRLIGDLDPATASQLRTEFIDLVGHGVRTVTVDLGGLDFIDSTGLGVLVGGLKRLREHGGDLALRSPSASALKVFEITGLTKLFAIS